MKTLATKSEIFKAAHKLTKETRKATDSYSATFSICLKYIYSQLKNTKMEQVEKTIEELKNEIKAIENRMRKATITIGTEKQINWATSLRVQAASNVCFQIVKKAATELSEKKQKNILKEFIELHKDSKFEDASFFINNR